MLVSTDCFVHRSKLSSVKEVWEVSLSINHASAHFSGKHGSGFLVMMCTLLYTYKMVDIFLTLNITTSREHSKNSDQVHRQFGVSMFPLLVTLLSIRGSVYI